MNLKGPGTGISPFVSYLRSIDFLSQSNQEFNKNMLLFYGCRHPKKDFLFKEEILQKYIKYLKNFNVSFSRYLFDKDDINNIHDDSILKYYISNSKYVQDSIKHYSKEITHLIRNLNAYIFVCGDAKNMSKDVYNCIAQCLSSDLNITIEEANSYMLEMVKTKRYKQDIWA